VQLSQARTAAVLEYAELADQAGRGEGALGHLAGLAAREPLNEKACARLMLTLASLGQQAAALHAYEQLRLRLDEQLGVLPGPELARAHLRVLRQQFPAASTGGPPANGSAPMPGPWPVAASSMVGEAAALAEMPRPAAEAVGADRFVHPPADSWVAAVHASEDDVEPIGTAVTIDANRLLTCAHVVVTADGTAREPLWVSFPKADRWPRRRVAAVTVAYSLPTQDLAASAMAARCGSGTPKPASSVSHWRPPGRRLRPVPGHRRGTGAAGQRRQRRHGPDLGPRDRPAAHHAGRPPGRRQRRLPGHRRREGTAGQRR
jgi:hypothetical protein